MYTIILRPCNYFIKNMCEPAKIDGFWNNSKNAMVLK